MKLAPLTLSHHLLKEHHVLPSTEVTRRIIAMAEEAGLHPEVRPAFGNSYRVVLDAKAGMDSPIGYIEIGRRSGRVLRATVTVGLSSSAPQRVELDGVAAVRRWLQGHIGVTRQ
ncbi:hypothetical protein ACIOGZ_28450 [Kitasatospora sp. NPDC088160]|uniref:hypothetical protein n=1 Tax=Kitasatospora sp. NPDC088160 TaxID=3364072 RepID=UPI0038243F82